MKIVYNCFFDEDDKYNMLLHFTTSIRFHHILCISLISTTPLKHGFECSFSLVLILQTWNTICAVLVYNFIYKIIASVTPHVQKRLCWTTKFECIWWSFKHRLWWRACIKNTVRFSILSKNFNVNLKHAQMVQSCEENEGTRNKCQLSVFICSNLPVSHR